jgi:hypothetical protein
MFYYNAGVVCSYKFRKCWVNSWSQSYDRELQRQRCKKLQYQEYKPSAFVKQKNFQLWKKL